MKKPIPKIDILIIGVVVLALTMYGCHLGFWYYNSVLAPIKKFDNFQIGCSVDDIQRNYGNPKYIATDQKTQDQYLEQYSSYYPHNDRKISNKVFIYEAGSIYVVFIYIGKDNKSEYIYRGKT